MVPRLSRRALIAAGLSAALVPTRKASAIALNLDFHVKETVTPRGWYLPPPPYTFGGSPTGVAESYIEAQTLLGEDPVLCPGQPGVPAGEDETSAYYMTRRLCFRPGDEAMSTLCYVRHVTIATGTRRYRSDLDHNEMLGVWTGQSSGAVIDLSGAVLLHNESLTNSAGDNAMGRWWLTYPGQPTGSWIMVTAKQHPVLTSQFWWEFQACKWSSTTLDGFIDDEEVRKP
jgi:hypothetical protein